MNSMNTISYMLSVMCLVCLLLVSAGGCKDNTAVPEKDKRQVASVAKEKSTSRGDDLLKRLEAIDRLDKLDFQKATATLDSCLQEFSFTCVEQQYSEAAAVAATAEDRKQLQTQRASIDGARVLVKIRKAIGQDSFSGIDTLLAKAKGYEGTSLYRSMVEATAENYAAAYTAYQARKEKEAAQRRAKDEEERSSLPWGYTFCNSIGSNCEKKFCSSSSGSCADSCNTALSACGGRDESFTLANLCEAICGSDRYCSRRCRTDYSLSDVVRQYSLDRL
jgi:hypothetical protein